MSVDLFQFGTLLKNLSEGCKVALDCLVKSDAPESFIVELRHASDSLESACCTYLECLTHYVRVSGIDSKSELS